MRGRADLPEKNDFAVAFKAVALVRGLSGDAKTVAIVILSHFNAKTGQCDPGTERIAARAGISTRNVVKATNALDESGLVVKTRHGGNGFRSSYQPNWRLFRDIVKAFEGPDGMAQTVNKRSLRQCTNVHLDNEPTFTLTHIRNSPKKLKDTFGGSGGVSEHGRQEPSKPVIEDRVKGLLSSSLRRPTAVKHPPLSVVDAQEAARLQIDTQIEMLSETMRAFVLGGLTPEIQNEAIIAEQKTRGAGLRLVVDRVSRIAATAGRH